jgi:DnaJ-domain-containing protein 1
VRQAYLSLAKAHHPDRFVNVELPIEVVNYLSVMARRINAAYRALEELHQLRKQAGETTT